MKNKFKWLVEIEVDPTWIADGYDLQAVDVQEAIREYSLGYAYPDEVKVKVLKKPNKKRILKEQGFVK